MWLFLPFGFFSAVWCKKPSLVGRHNEEPLFPNGAMMIRSRTEAHLQWLLCDFADSLAMLKPQAVGQWESLDKTFGFTKAATLLPESKNFEETIYKVVQMAFPILEQAGSDYRWRIFMERFLWGFYLYEMASTIDYSNFKNEAKRFATVVSDDMDGNDIRYQTALTRVWSVMYGLQNDLKDNQNQTVLPFPSEEDVQAQADWEDAGWLPDTEGEQ